ncbi:523_t:CDS:2 [Paraglomus brasilianum]|uniref:Peroxisome assembly protein 12 n=1 Tax=Paraglomus brasilianum TaxID=144538 RepID=A0A9N9FJ31_9GLOM|nr:523_t:CDS:2 [Paraglomus brasilianum]
MEFMSDLGSSADIYRPTLFELISQEKMRDLLQPAVKYVLSIYAQRYPRYLLRIVNAHEEFYALIMFFVERHYLKEWGGSFAENFYGLKRIRSLRKGKVLLEEETSHKELKKLRDVDVSRSLIFLVGLPYVKAKLDDLYERLGGGIEAQLLGDDSDEEDYEDTSQMNRSDRLISYFKRGFKRWYPWINFLYHSSIWIFVVAYLAEKTRYHSPWLKLLGIEVRRMSLQDYQEYFKRKSRRQTPAPPSTWLEACRRSLIVGLAGILNLLKIILPMSIFFYKFLEWWYSSDYAKRIAGDSTVNVPPPERIEPDPEGIGIPDTPNTCPLCIDELKNPTALPSGYVFCYSCIYPYVEEHGKCPVTLIKVDIEELRRVYSAGS